MTGSLLALFLTLSMPAAPHSAGETVQETRASAPAQVVNINTATAAQLEALPGIGPSMAQRIVSHREKNGPFKKAEDLMNVKGIGEKSFLKLKALITVGPARAEA